MKTPITYYGGKQKLVSAIVPRIPGHTLYCEPFAGGAAIFFSKPASEIEVLNDTNRELINFYQVMQNDYATLEREIRVTLHSRSAHADAKVVYKNPHLFSAVKRAWAVWVLAAQSFSAKLDGSFGYDKTEQRTSRLLTTRRESFTEELAIRLQNVQIECADARYIIQSRDASGSFFYIDPPYFNSDCGHYEGYTKEDFQSLLDLLSTIKGKFLLSSYPSEILRAATKEHGWHMWSVEKQVSVNAKSGYLKRKIEVLTANYPIE